MGMELAAVAVAGLLLAALGIALWRAMKKGHAADATIEMLEAKNAQLEAQAKQRRQALPTDAEWAALADKRVRDADARGD